MRRLTSLAAAAPLLFCAACAVGPNYKRPAAIVAPAYKEAPPEAFKEALAAGLEPANPCDALRQRQVVGDLQRSGSERARRAGQHQ